MKINEGKVLLWLSGILSGIVVTSFIVNTSGSPTKFLSSRDYQRNSKELNRLKSEIVGLNRRYYELVPKLNTYENSSEMEKSVTDTLKSELGDVKKFYGLTDVEGPGLKIMLGDRNDPDINIFDDFELSNSIVHNTDLLYVVNELKNAGAEAVSINGNRVINSTSITCEGVAIKINGQPIISPFEILAIGSPDALQFALTLDEGYFSGLVFRKLNYSIEPQEKVKIKAIKNANPVRYMKEVK